jgi:hypothetical protein
MEIRGRLALAAAFAALALPASAGAALEVRLTIVPASPKAGTQAVVQLRPYWTYLRPDGSCCKLVPADVRYPFKVEARSPTERVFRVAVRRTQNRYVWAGSFVFRVAGRWTVRAPQWGPSYSAHYGARPRIRFLVKR